MKDIVVTALCILGFATTITAHVAIVLGLALRPPRWRALVAFVLLVPGPYWAWRERMRVRVVFWAVGLLVYLVGLVLATRGG